MMLRIKGLTIPGPMQVLDLLDSMELSQYKESFRREQVSGDVFVMVNEEVLKNELDVRSKIHRMRLMKVATGRFPLTSSTGYVKFTK